MVHSAQHPYLVMGQLRPRHEDPMAPVAVGVGKTSN